MTPSSAPKLPIDDFQAIAVIAIFKSLTETKHHRMFLVCAMSSKTQKGALPENSNPCCIASPKSSLLEKD